MMMGLARFAVEILHSSAIDIYTQETGRHFPGISSGECIYLEAAPHSLINEGEDEPGGGPQRRRRRIREIEMRRRVSGLDSS